MTRSNGNKDREKYGTSQLFNFNRDSYLERTSRPIYAIIFLLPFIVFYELGTIFINTDALNRSEGLVVAFVWLQKFMAYLGFGSRITWMTPAFVVVIILLALQLASGKRWNFNLRDIWLMVGECILFAVPLIVLSMFLNSFVQANDKAVAFDTGTRQVSVETLPLCAAAVDNGSNTADNSWKLKKEILLVDIVTGIGAGIYEELVFRLILICALMLLFQDALRLGHKNSIILSVLISAALFSAHHHIDFLSGRLNQTDPFDLTRFAFRTIAGVYFAVLFAVRGFGIAAGSHIFYDIIAVFIKDVFFPQ
jgi:membrane protease YdiL (CAAX protease family)